MDSCIGPITNGFIDKITNEVKKKKTKEKIMNGIIDPLLKDISTRYYPYLITITSILVVIILLLIAILILLVFQKSL
jgi:hypothetical protein